MQKHRASAKIGGADSDRRIGRLLRTHTRRPGRQEHGDAERHRADVLRCCCPHVSLLLPLPAVLGYEDAAAGRSQVMATTIKKVLSRGTRAIADAKVKTDKIDATVLAQPHVSGF